MFVLRAFSSKKYLKISGRAAYKRVEADSCTPEGYPALQPAPVWSIPKVLARGPDRMYLDEARPNIRTSTEATAQQAKLTRRRAQTTGGNAE